jgi:hypothetical protein
MTQSLLKDNFVNRWWRAGPDGVGQRRDDQEVSDVQRVDWTGRGLRTDDVQALQACLLLVLPHLTRRKLSVLFSPILSFRDILVRVRILLFFFSDF